MTTAPSAFRLAARLDEVGFSDIVKLRNQIMKLREAGEQVFQFEGGEPFLDTPAHVKEAMTRALAENRTRYAPSSGIPELRAALAEKLRTRNRLPAADRDVIVLSGGMHGLFGAFQSVVNHGDEVLLFSPYWTPIKDLVSYCGGRAVFVPTDEARREGFAEILARHTTARTRALYFNTPQNPTGLVFTRAEAEAVAAFARERDLVVVADEAYEDLIYDGEHVSIASLEGMFERTITCYTLSKSFSMTGWRIGYAAAAEPWMTGLRKTTLYSTNGVSTPTQWAALAAVNSPADFFADARAEYRRRRDLLVSGLNELGLACEPPAGAFYAFPVCARIDPDSRTAADQLLERARVSTVPGAVFGPHGEGHLRLSFSTSIETIEAALDSMRRHL